MTTTVWATHRFAGFHCWPDAPPDRHYLAMPHRHLFHVRAEVDVLHDDREIEFHDLYDVLVGECARLAEAGGQSCEMMAGHLVGVLVGRWPGRRVTVDVSEDGEFGSSCCHPG